jgi:hypothetical protein
MRIQPANNQLLSGYAKSRVFADKFNIRSIDIIENT